VDDRHRLPRFRRALLRNGLRMSQQAADVHIVPLVANLELPRRASPRLRAEVPAGYGVEEQCLPFTAANGLGFVIPSPITFGWCAAGDVPQSCRAFAPPMPIPGPRANWVFYVQDDSSRAFAGNAYRIVSPTEPSPIVEPGVSFFDREDQADLFKLHLPYIWRTATEVDTLFVGLMNRSAQNVTVLAGLVETDWYGNPVNLVLRLMATPLHVHAGDEIAQAILIARSHRRPELYVAASHSRATRDAHQALREWQRQHASDRSAYKVLARSHQGRLE